MEQELAQLLQKEEEIQLVEPQLLPDTPLKTERRQKIQEKETVLSEQIGIPNIFRFDNLQDLKLVVSYFKILTEKKPIQAILEHRLDANDERIIDDCFKNDLEKQIRNHADYQPNSQYFDALKQSILESSFISTLFSKSHPQIGKLLHLPEMDPNIVHKYDRKIINECIETIIRLVVQKFDPSLMVQMLAEAKDHILQKDINRLEEKLNQTQDYILFLLKGNKPDSNVERQKMWIEIRNNYKTSINNIETKNLFNDLTKEISVIGFFKLIGGMIGYPIFGLIFEIEKLLEKENFSLSLMNYHSGNLDVLYNLLINLKELEKLVLKKRNKYRIQFYKIDKKLNI